MPHAYTTFGSSFSHHSAGASNNCAEDMPYMVWRQLHGGQLSDIIFVARMDAEIAGVMGLVKAKTSVGMGKEVGRGQRLWRGYGLGGGGCRCGRKVNSVASEL